MTAFLQSQCQSHNTDTGLKPKRKEHQYIGLSENEHHKRYDISDDLTTRLNPHYGLRKDAFGNMNVTRVEKEPNPLNRGSERDKISLQFWSEQVTTDKGQRPPKLSLRKRKVSSKTRTVWTMAQRKTKKALRDAQRLNYSNYTKNKKSKLTVASISEKSSSGENCMLKPSENSLTRFRHLVYYKHLNFVYLNLHTGENVSFLENELVVESKKWVWTFYGREGALEILRWPAEFGIWSMGLLDVFTMSINVKLQKVRGNCLGLTVGQQDSDFVIGSALLQLSQSLMNFSHEYESKYGPSFFCYKKRTFINPSSLYILCENIMCPLESLEYKCCSYFYNPEKSKREMTCHPRFKYDSLWWIVPTVVASIVFASCPLLMMAVAGKCSESLMPKTRQHTTDTISDDRCTKFIYLDDKYPLTLSGTLFSPIIALIGKIAHWSRLVRALIPICSLSIIMLQIFLDYLFLYDMVLLSIKKGVFLGFRSLIAGYAESSHHFMEYLGGPYIALAAYLVLTCLFMAVPDCLSTLLEKGLAKDRQEGLAVTILYIDLKTISHFGSESIVNASGYYKIYSTFLGQFFMLLNLKFWRYTFVVFTARWQLICRSRYLFTLLPFYLAFCVIELVICILINSLPIVSFGLTICKAYIIAFSSCISFRRPRLLNLALKLFLNSLLIACVIYFMFMFCSICFDACLFITRVFMFTYTGIIIYPKESYGYLIFIFTVLYYLVECANHFSVTYRRLLEISIRACASVQRVNNQHRLVHARGDCKGIHKLLFRKIVEVHRPKRRQVFVSFFKLFLILAILGISLNLLTKTDRFMQLNTLVHVGTALFTCAMPTIFMKMCRTPDERYKQRVLKIEIVKTIEDYSSYLHSIDSELSSD